MQLEGYILSLRECFSSPVRLSVLFKAGNQGFDDAYLKLQNSFPDVDFIIEKNFRRQVSKWLGQAEGPFVMFGCDDVVFTGSVDHTVITDAFNNHDLFGFSLRLGLTVTYSTMYRTPMTRPLFIRKAPFLLWNWRDTAYDWGYPFELDCTIYRKNFMEKFIGLLDADAITHPNWPNTDSSFWGHPNRFEGFGSALAKKLNAFSLMASFPSPKGIVVTVNRVQDECKNSVYDPSGAMTSEKLLEMWNGGIILDRQAYSAEKHRSIHVGNMFLCQRNAPAEKITLQDYDAFKVMVTDFAKAVSSTAGALRANPRFPDYIKEFDEYFHMPGAETDGPVNFFPCLADNTGTTHVDREYFYQDTWCFSRVAAAAPRKIVDIGSTVLLVGIMSYIAPTESIDIRPLQVKLPGLSCLKGSITDLPFEDKTVEMLTSICVIEHIGLGRYGDPLDPLGSWKAFREISRVIAPGGRFIGSVPIAKEPFVLFNANRVLQKDDILAFFPDFKLEAEQYLYPEPGSADTINNLPDFEYGTWCFELKRNA